VDPFPPQLFVAAEPGKVVRSSLEGGDQFPARPVTIPPNTTAKLLIQRDVMISAYPSLEVQGGADATINLQYGEALYDKDGKKGDRNLIADRQLRGFHDTFIADGQMREFAPLWWRTFRYLEIEVKTSAKPLTLRALKLHESGYPFAQVASFVSSDADLNRIWQIGWRTMRVDSHETFMDSSYWEQLQYTGDTRLEMLITYAVSGDARLARQAIDAFAESDVDGGLVQGAYPSRLPNVIATFSFAWVGMLADWALEQPDTAFIVRHLPRMRRALTWFEPLLNKQGLLGKNPQWNFIDWSGQEWDDRDTFPSWGSQNGSCLTTAMWVGALRQGAALERAHGDAARAAEFDAKADRARTAIREHCWVAEKGLFADDGDKKVFSQHMNVFAVLYDIATPDEAPAILEKITIRDRGIDAPAGMYAPTAYFRVVSGARLRACGKARALLRAAQDLARPAGVELHHLARIARPAPFGHARVECTPDGRLVRHRGGHSSSRAGLFAPACRAAAWVSDLARCHCGDAAWPGQGELSHRRQSTDRRDRSARLAPRNFHLARQVAPADGDTHEVRTAALKEFPCLPAASS
jgi:hypothetical protein